MISKATGRKVNLTLKEDEYDEEKENDKESDGEEYDADMCHPESCNVDGEYTAKSCVIRRIMLTPKVNEQSQRHNLFKTRCFIHQKIFDVIIDGGSTKNTISRDIVQRLKLPIEKHQNPYRIRWIKSVGEINVTKRCKVPFTIGKYKEEVVCDIIDMDACHVLLGRPWEFDVNATRKGKDNTYSFRLNGVKKIMVPLIENSKPKVLEEKRNNLMIMSHQDFEDEIKGESVVYAVVAT
ncbi:transposon ty3-I gag-pol polyprotein [Tanacetum coccineum]